MAARILVLILAAGLAAAGPTPTPRAAGDAPNPSDSAGTPSKPTDTCACAYKGLNSVPCFKGVTKWCSDAAAKPDNKVCAAFSGFLNRQEYSAGVAVAKFLVDTCKLALPKNTTSCACLEGYGTIGCRAAALSACVKGNSLCPSLVFGAEAVPKSLERFGEYVRNECAAAAGVTQVVLDLTGVRLFDFRVDYAHAVVVTIAAIAHRPASSVLLSKIREAGTLGTPDHATARRLQGAVETSSTNKAAPPAASGAVEGAPEKRFEAVPAAPQPPKLRLTFDVYSSPADAANVAANLEAAAAHGAAGLHEALAHISVPLKPSMRVLRTPGDDEDAAAAAPKSSGLSGSASAAVALSVLAAAAAAGGGAWALRRKLRAQQAVTALDSESVASGSDYCASKPGGKKGGEKKIFATAGSGIFIGADARAERDTDKV